MYCINKTPLIFAIIFLFFNSGLASCLTVEIRAMYENDSGYVVDSINWRKISLAIYDNIGTLKIDIQLLRDLDWIEENNAVVGCDILLSILEKGIINEKARILSINHCPELLSNEGNLVTGIFISFGPTIMMEFIDSDDVIECTYGHRFYSKDNDEWISAQNLSVGEKICTKDGFVTVASLAFHDEIKEVFNLEVADDHTYCVTNDDVISHNNDPCVTTFYDPRKPNALIQPGGKKTISYEVSHHYRLEDFFDDVRLLKENKLDIGFPDADKPSWSNLFTDYSFEHEDMHGLSDSFFSFSSKIILRDEITKWQQSKLIWDFFIAPPNSLNPKTSVLAIREFGPIDEAIYTATHPGFDVKNYQPDTLAGDPLFGDIRQILLTLNKKGTILVPAGVDSGQHLRSVHAFWITQNGKLKRYTYRTGVGWE